MRLLTLIIPLAAAMLASAALPALAQSVPPGAPAAPPQMPATVTVRVGTIDRMLAFLQMDGGQMASSIGNDLRQEAIPQIQAFQAKQIADMKKAPDEAKAAATSGVIATETKPAEPAKP